MRAFAKAMAAAIALAAAPALQAQGPVSGLRPSEPAAIVAAAQSCNAAIAPQRLDEARLTADGWSGGDVRGRGGERVDTSLRIFSRGRVLLFATPDMEPISSSGRPRSPTSSPHADEQEAGAGTKLARTSRRGGAT